LPYGILNAKNPLTGAQGSFTYASDLNMNGAYDASDRLTGKNLNLYCLISPASFSCSNFVAAGFKDSDQVRLIGRHTSGGGCIVQHLSTADGTLFATSGNRQLASVRNGAFTSIDDGVEADVTLDSYADFFYRAALAKKLATF
jgi:C-terminal processing protease CtpA/Prc